MSLPDLIPDDSDLPSHLSDEQKAAYLYCISSESPIRAFITGHAGCGKTTLLRSLVDGLRKTYDSVNVTAPTGLAAVAIEGVTLHSFLGIRPQTICYRDDMLRKAPNDRIRACSYLIIDEISMVSPRLLDEMNAAFKIIRRNDLHFGGINVVVFGDFFQLPPVNGTGYAFESKCWPTFTPFYLRNIFRQTDRDMLHLLHDVRKGILSEASMTLLASRITSLDNIPSSFTTLFSLVEGADCRNQTEIAKLPGAVYTFTAYDQEFKSQCLSMLDSTPVPKILQLKKGARVMLRQNCFDHGLVNGSCGYTYS